MSTPSVQDRLVSSSRAPMSDETIAGPAKFSSARGSRKAMNAQTKRTAWLLAVALMVTVCVMSPKKAEAVIAVDAVSTGDTQPASLTISHTTGSGTNRLMLVGISFVNDEMETVTSVTYNGVALTWVGTGANGDDARMEIWRLIAPPTGTYNVVITFSAPLRRAAVAGVMTFTGVHQTTPLGTFVSAVGNASPATVNVTSAANELVFDTVACESCTSFTVGPSQTQRWNLSAPDGPRLTPGAGSTELGAVSVTMSWTQGFADYWAIGGVSIKPAAAAGIAFDAESEGHTGSSLAPSLTVPHTVGDGGTNRILVVGVNIFANTAGSNGTISENRGALPCGPPW